MIQGKVRKGVNNPVEDCIFCKIVAGEIPCQKVYEDEKILAFKDIAPQAPVHVVLIPKEHVANILEMRDSTFWSQLQEAIKKITNQEKIDNKGFRLISNCGQDGGQTVNHLHFHLLGGRSLGWPPG